MNRETHICSLTGAWELEHWWCIDYPSLNGNCRSHKSCWFISFCVKWRIWCGIPLVQMCWNTNQMSGTGRETSAFLCIRLHVNTYELCAVSYPAVSLTLYQLGFAKFVVNQRCCHMLEMLFLSAVSRCQLWAVVTWLTSCLHHEPKWSRASGCCSTCLSGSGAPGLSSLFNWRSTQGGMSPLSTGSSVCSQDSLFAHHSST